MNIDIDQVVSSLFEHAVFRQRLHQEIESNNQRNCKNKVFSSSEQSNKENEVYEIDVLNMPSKQENDQRYSISSSVFPTRQSRQSINSMQSNPPVFGQFLQRCSEVSVDKITIELSTLLETMVKKECEVSFKTNKNLPLAEQGFSELIEEMSKIQDEKIQKFREQVQAKIDAGQSEVSLSEKVQDIILKLQQERKQKKINSKTSNLKKQRRQVTQSILDMSRNPNNSMSSEFNNFSNLNHCSNILSDSEDEDLDPFAEVNNISAISNQQLSQLCERVQSTEKQCTKMKKEFEKKFRKEIEDNCKDIQGLTDRIVEWKMKNQEKIENGFGGIWNVITDINEKMAKVDLRLEDLQEKMLSSEEISINKSKINL